MLIKLGNPGIFKKFYKKKGITLRNKRIFSYLQQLKNMRLRLTYSVHDVKNDVQILDCCTSFQAFKVSFPHQNGSYVVFLPELKCSRFKIRTYF